ncbi:MAG: hypothetical protein QF615_12825, partial [Planctomycetota bacterium]|nr:hypothetical protein [Planctomycetota bacterium]
MTSSRTKLLLLALLLALGGGLILIAVGLGDADGGAGAQGIEVAESNGESSEDAGADRGVVELPQELEGRADVQPVPWP